MTDTELLSPRSSRSAGHPNFFTPFTTADRRPLPAPTPERLITIHCAGQDFRARSSLAAIFLRHALQIVAVHGSGLVPLLHTGGIELLLITPATAAACRYDGWTLADIHDLERATKRSS